MRHSLPALFLAIGVAPAYANGGGDDTSNVVGGTTVPAGKWPDALALLGQQAACSGTLIAPDVVLTAGHCIGEASDIIIADTTDYNGPGGEEIAVEAAAAYPNWQNTYDVGVLRLAQPSTVTPRPVGIGCTFDTEFPQGAQVQLVGFGLTDAAGQGNNTALHEATTTVTDPDCTGGDGCQAAVSPGGEFVAGGGGIDTCFGDSGGPVYLQTAHGTVVVGLTSRGTDSAQACGDGGIYVRTDKIVNWLEQTTGRTIAKATCATGSDPGDPDDPGTPGGGGGGGDDDGPQDIRGGCSAGGASGGSFVAIALGALVAWSRRRRSR